MKAWMTGAVSGAFYGGTTPINRTIDGGITLLPINLRLEGPYWFYGYTAISALSDSIAFAVFNDSIICRTFDAGNTWQLDTMRYKFNDIKMISPEKAWLVGDSGRIACTRDGGKSWVLQSSPVRLRLTSLSAIDSATVWAVGQQGAILRTTTGGESWIAVPSPTTMSLSSVCFTDRFHGWIVGDSGAILRYFDGSVTMSSKTESRIVPSSMELSLYPNPFNPQTTIALSIAKSSNAIVRVYDVIGRELETIYSGELRPGIYTFSWSPRNVSTGIYLVSAMANNQIMTKKAMLLR
jgi:photosystem II stability/assembly factor-like uncharacterized protein